MSQFLPHNPLQDRGDFEKAPRTVESIMSSRFFEVLFGVRDLKSLGQEAEERQRSRTERHLSIVPAPQIIETPATEPAPIKTSPVDNKEVIGIDTIRAKVTESLEDHPPMSLDEEIRRAS